MSANFTVDKDHAGEWRWAYHSSNGATIGVSSEGYKNREDCIHSIDLMRGSKDAGVLMEAEDNTA